MKEDTTEDVLNRGKMPPYQLTQNDLYNVDNIGLWRKIMELYSCNDRSRSDGGVQKNSENSTCAGIEQL